MSRSRSSKGVSELNLGAATWTDNLDNANNWYLLDTANTKFTEGDGKLVMTSINPGWWRRMGNYQINRPWRIITCKPPSSPVVPAQGSINMAYWHVPLIRIKVMYSSFPVMVITVYTPGMDRTTMPFRNGTPQRPYQDGSQPDQYHGNLDERQHLAPVCQWL